MLHGIAPYPVAWREQHVGAALIGLRGERAMKQNVTCAGVNPLTLTLTII